MVTLQILVLPFLVRVRVSQHTQSRTLVRLLFFYCRSGLFARNDDAIDRCNISCINFAVAIDIGIGLADA